MSTSSMKLFRVAAFAALLLVFRVSPLLGQPPAAQEYARARQASVEQMLERYSLELESRRAALSQREQALNVEREQVLARFTQLQAAVSQLLPEAVSSPGRRLTNADVQELATRREQLARSLGAQVEALQANQRRTEALAADRATAERLDEAVEAVTARFENVSSLRLLLVEDWITAADEYEDQLLQLAIAADDKIPVTIRTLSQGAQVHYQTSAGRKRGDIHPVHWRR